MTQFLDRVCAPLEGPVGSGFAPGHPSDRHNLQGLAAVPGVLIPVSSRHNQSLSDPSAELLSPVLYDAVLGKPPDGTRCS